jgi:hypothetical protein
VVGYYQSQKAPLVNHHISTRQVPLTTHHSPTTMLFFGKKKRLIDYASCAG